MKTTCKIKTVIVLIILIISLLSNLLLFFYSRKYYLQFNQTLLDPLGLNYYSAERNITNQGSQKTVLLYGDSRILDWPSPSDSRFNFVNRGINGQTSSQILHRFDYDVSLLKPKIIILQFCINDLKIIPLFPELKNPIISQCKNNIRQIIEKSNNLNSVIILTTIFPVGTPPPERRLFWSSDVSLAVEEVNAYIRSLELDNVVILDSYSLLVNDDGLINVDYAKDFLHINLKGYEILNKALEQILSNIAN